MTCKGDSFREIAWEKVKQSGSDHYKTGDIEPIDLYRSLGILRPFCIASIIKYAARNAGTGKPEDNPVSNKDLNKIIHYCEILKCSCGE
jgi:AMMECR1 domain-containing protein